jgi:hypothetical protein
MTVSFVVSFMVAFAMGYLAVRAIWPEDSRNVRPGIIVLRVCLSFGLGMGLSSCLYFFWLESGAYRFGFIPYIAAELLVFLGLYVIGAHKAGKTQEHVIKTAGVCRSFRLVRITVFVLFIAALVISAASFLSLSSDIPHGEWDAYSIWNQHARFMFRDPALWKEMFHDTLKWSHPDYPLLLPASVARSWQYIGSEAPFAAQAIAFFFVFALAAVAISTVSLLKGQIQGMLCGFAFFSSAYLVQYAAMQYADIPLAFFLTASVSLYLLYCDSRDKVGLLVLAGLMASLAAWTKNEGIIFFLLFSMLVFLFERNRVPADKSRAPFKYFLAGVLPVVITLIFFKTTCALNNDVVTAMVSDPAGAVSRFTDLQRHFFILKSLANSSYFGGNIGKYGLLIYLAVVGISVSATQRKGLRLVLILYCCMAAAYYLVFITTSSSLEWLIACSMNRVFAQLLPILIVTFFIAARSADEILSVRMDKENK